jgi:hypothetical protein
VRQGAGGAGGDARACPQSIADCSFGWVGRWGGESTCRQSVPAAQQPHAARPRAHGPWPLPRRHTSCRAPSRAPQAGGGRVVRYSDAAHAVRRSLLRRALRGARARPPLPPPRHPARCAACGTLVRADEPWACRCVHVLARARIRTPCPATRGPLPSLTACLLSEGHCSTARASVHTTPPFLPSWWRPGVPHRR